MLLFILLFNTIVPPPHYVHYQGPEEVKILLFTRETPFIPVNNCSHKKICTEIKLKNNQITLGEKKIILKPGVPSLQVSEILRLKLILTYKYASKTFIKQQEAFINRRKMKQLSQKIKKKVIIVSQKQISKKNQKQDKIIKVNQNQIELKSLQHLTQNTLKKMEQLTIKNNQIKQKKKRIRFTLPPKKKNTPQNHLIEFALSLSNSFEIADIFGLSITYQYHTTQNLFIGSTLNIYTGGKTLNYLDYDYDGKMVSMQLLSLDLIIGQKLFQWHNFRLNSGIGLTTSYLNIENSKLKQKSFITLRGTGMLQLCYQIQKQFGLAFTFSGSFSIIESEKVQESQYDDYFELFPGQFKISLGGYFNF